MKYPNDWTLEQILTLSFYDKINSSIMKEVVEQYNNLNHLLDSKLPLKLNQIFRQGSLFNQNNIKDEVQKQLDISSRNGYNIVTCWDSNYPRLLKEIPYPPVLLYVWGNLQEAESISISIVGTRECTNYGRSSAERFAKHLTQNNIIVCSGAARGIDSVAHQTVIQNNGVTYAVVASGVDSIEHTKYQIDPARIVNAGGAVISEYRFGTKAQLAYFPQRNRIISGISKATIVIESGERGGSLITARFAFDQSREVFALPGNIDSEKSKGTNMLIKRNTALPALSPENVLEELCIEKSLQIPFSQEPAATLVTDENERIILEYLGKEPVHIDQIADKTGMEIPQLLVKLLNLEFSNLISQLPGKFFIRLK